MGKEIKTDIESGIERVRARNTEREREREKQSDREGIEKEIEAFDGKLVLFDSQFKALQTSNNSRAVQGGRVGGAERGFFLVGGGEGGS